MDAAKENLAQAGLDCRVDGAVASVTLNRPEVLNAQHPAMWAGIARFLEALDSDVRVVVVRGSNRVFSAGLDLSLIDPSKQEQAGNLIAAMRLSHQEISDMIGEYQRPFTMLSDPRFISIAVVEGAAVGAGFQLALACDLRIMTTDAWFCMKEPALGLVPDLTGTKPLVEAVGYARALEICAAARRVGADEAGRIGLVQRVVPADDLDATLSALIGSLVNNDAAAVRATTELVRGAGGRTLDEQRLAERNAQVARFRAVLPQ